MFCNYFESGSEVLLRGSSVQGCREDHQHGGEGGRGGSLYVFVWEPFGADVCV